MNLKKHIVVIVLFFVATLLAADDFLVTWAEGKVEFRQGAAWKQAAVGELIPDTSEVRLGANGLLELRRKKETITVSQSGTYLLKNFIQQSRERKSSRLFAGVDAKIKNLAGAGNTRGKSAAAGVKGDVKENPASDPTWSDEENQTFAQGLDLIAAEKYKGAADYFLAVLKADHDASAEPELHYYLAFACDRNGETARAIKYADKLALDPADPRFPDYALLKGNLLVKGFSYGKALDVINRYLAAYPKGDNAQDMLLLAAYCYRNTGDVAREREALKKAAAIDPTSDAGKEAAAELKSP